MVSLSIPPEESGYRKACCRLLQARSNPHKRITVNALIWPCSPALRSEHASLGQLAPRQLSIAGKIFKLGGMTDTIATDMTT